MKTTTSFYYSPLLRRNEENSKTIDEKADTKTVQHTDLKNHRFSLIDNKSIHDPSNWDSSWFTNYE